MSPRAPVYLDYAATTPVDARVAAAMRECLTLDGVFGNPASVHAHGRRARERVEQARAQVAALIGASSRDIVFTSGATESNNFAILGTARSGSGGHIVTARTEHRSVLDACRALEREGFSVSYLEPDGEGLISLEQVRAALRPETVLVALMHANNELGVVQEIEPIGRLCRERGVPLHVDAAQSAGKLEFDVRRLGASLLAFTAHKLYGPKGVGALYVAPERRASLQPLLFGGGQERGLRSGTLPVHQIVGFGLACELARAEYSDEAPRLRAWRDRLWQGLSRLEGVLRNGHPTHNVPGILNVSFRGVEGESLLMGLSELAVSSGSACNSEHAEPSYVLRALGRDTELAQSSLRFSLGRFTREEHIEVALDAVVREVGRLRAAAGSLPVMSTVPAPPSVNEGEFDALAPTVRSLFGELQHAGEFVGADVRHGEAGREQRGTRVRFSLRIRDDRIVGVRYLAYGCPYTLAACEWIARELEAHGGSLARIGAALEGELGSPQAWLQRLQIPPARLGRLLMIEDALRAALEATDAAVTHGG